MSADEKLDLPRGLTGEDVLKELSTLAMRCGGCGKVEPRCCSVP